MTLSLACTWQPRGELSRLQRLYPQIRQLCDRMIVTLPPDVDHAITAALGDLPGMTALVTDDWRTGRHLAVETALRFDAPIHYIDLDRLLHWVETNPTELEVTIARILSRDCLVMGRTEWAYATHPQSMIETEAIINQVFSALIGHDMDISAGSRGMSHRAAKFVIERSVPNRPLGMDAEWLLLLHYNGFELDYVAVDGLAWETPDQYRDSVADETTRRLMAADYDSQAQSWQQRVGVAAGIIDAGLDVVRQISNKNSEVNS